MEFKELLKHFDNFKFNEEEIQVSLKHYIKNEQNFEDLIKYCIKTSNQEILNDLCKQYDVRKYMYVFNFDQLPIENYYHTIDILTGIMKCEKQIPLENMKIMKKKWEGGYENLQINFKNERNLGFFYLFLMYVENEDRDMVLNNLKSVYSNLKIKESILNMGEFVPKEILNKLPKLEMEDLLTLRKNDSSEHKEVDEILYNLKNNPQLVPSHIDKNFIKDYQNYVLKNFPYTVAFDGKTFYKILHRNEDIDIDYLTFNQETKTSQSFKVTSWSTCYSESSQYGKFHTQLKVPFDHVLYGFPERNGLQDCQSVASEYEYLLDNKPEGRCRTSFVGHHINFDNSGDSLVNFVKYFPSLNSENNLQIDHPYFRDWLSNQNLEALNNFLASYLIRGGVQVHPSHLVFFKKFKEFVPFLIKLEKAYYENSQQVIKSSNSTTSNSTTQSDDQLDPYSSNICKMTADNVPDYHHFKAWVKNRNVKPDDQEKAFNKLKGDGKISNENLKDMFNDDSVNFKLHPSIYQHLNETHLQNSIVFDKVPLLSLIKSPVDKKIWNQYILHRIKNVTIRDGIGNTTASQQISKRISNCKNPHEFLNSWFAPHVISHTGAETKVVKHVEGYNQNKEIPLNGALNSRQHSVNFAMPIDDHFIKYNAPFELIRRFPSFGFSQNDRELSAKKIADAVGIGNYVPDIGISEDVHGNKLNVQKNIKGGHDGEIEHMPKERELTKMMMFDWLILNGDRHSKNFMIDKESENSFHLIDHGLAFHYSKNNDMFRKPSYLPQMIHSDSLKKAIEHMIEKVPSLKHFQTLLENAKVPKQLHENHLHAYTSMIDFYNQIQHEHGFLNTSGIFNKMRGLLEEKLKF